MITKSLFLPFLFLLLSGCANTLSVRVNAAHYLNPDGQHIALPVQVKLYALTNRTAFIDATFRDLWLRDRETLGNAVITERSFIVSPNSKTLIKLKRIKRAKYLGVAAFFRSGSHSHWREIVKIKRNITSRWRQIEIRLKGNRLLIS